MAQEEAGSCLPCPGELWGHGGCHRLPTQGLQAMRGQQPGFPDRKLPNPWFAELPGCAEGLFQQRQQDVAAGAGVTEEGEGEGGGLVSDPPQLRGRRAVAAHETNREDFSLLLKKEAWPRRLPVLQRVQSRAEPSAGVTAEARSTGRSLLTAALLVFLAVVKPLCSVGSRGEHGVPLGLALMEQSWDSWSPFWAILPL